MGITYKRKLMFHQTAEKHSFCKQLTGRVEAEKVMEKNPRVLASCGSSQASSNSRYKKY